MNFKYQRNKNADQSQSRHRKNFTMAKGNIISDNQFYSLRNMNTNAPIVYGLPKIHKVNMPIRQVVSYVNTPSCKQEVFFLI